MFAGILPGDIPDLMYAAQKGFIPAKPNLRQNPARHIKSGKIKIVSFKPKNHVKKSR